VKKLSDQITSPFILVDIYEPEIIKIKIKELGVPFQVRPLEVGDYIVDGVIIERKEIHDLFSSLTSGRLWNQLYKIKETGLKGYLVVIGEIPTWDYRRKRPVSKKKYQYYFSTLRNIRRIAYLSYGVGFEHLKTTEDFFQFIVDVWNKTGRKVSYAPVLKKGSDLVTIKSNILTCIPGIGRKIADELAKKYKISDLVTLPINELSNVEVRGKKLKSRANKIKWALTN